MWFHSDIMFTFSTFLIPAFLETLIGLYSPDDGGNLVMFENITFAGNGRVFHSNSLCYYKLIVRWSSRSYASIFIIIYQIISDPYLVFTGGVVPLDHTPKIVITIVRIHEGIDWYLYTAMCLLAGLGILLAIFFLVFNIYYRNQK